MKFLKILAILFSTEILIISLGVHAKAKENELQSLAASNGFTLQEVDVGDFVITTYQKIQRPELKEFVIYIEGDGKAFANGLPTKDPTPLNPLVFKLATLDKRPNIIYLARPCQYTDKAKNPKCNNSFYWASGRMGKEVVESTSTAINKITKMAKCNLVGYSGGGGMAILVAAMDSAKISSIVTISGNLDVAKFKELHSLKPYFGPWVTYIDDSLNPLDYTDKIRNIPQILINENVYKITIYYEKMGISNVGDGAGGGFVHPHLPSAACAKSGSAGGGYGGCRSGPPEIWQNERDGSRSHCCHHHA